MAAVTLDVETTSRGGTALTFETPDAVDGVEFENVGKKKVMLVRNDSASPVTVTLEITQTLDGMTIPDRDVIVAAGDVTAIGPFNAIYNQSDGFVRATFSSVTDVSVALIALGTLSTG